MRFNRKIAEGVVQSLLYDPNYEKNITVSLLITQKCNYACGHCFYGCDKDMPAKYMSNETLMRVRSNCITLQELGFYPEINIIGGEPTVNLTQFERVMSLVNEFGREFPLYMTTNGWWIEKKATLRRFLVATRRMINSDHSIRISDDKFHRVFHKIYDDFDKHLKNIIEYPEDYFHTSEYDTEWMDWERVRNNVYTESHLSEYGVCPSGVRGTWGDADIGAKGHCHALSYNTITYLPGGKTYDGCCAGSDMPWGTVEDHPLVILMMNLYFARVGNLEPMSCRDCRERAYELRRSHTFRTAMKYFYSEVNSL